MKPWMIRKDPESYAAPWVVYKLADHGESYWYSARYRSWVEAWQRIENVEYAAQTAKVQRYPADR